MGVDDHLPCDLKRLAGRAHSGRINMDDEMRRKLNVVSWSCLRPIPLASLQQDSNSTLKQVQSWLEGLFTGEEIPVYEINSQTVDILYVMALQSERKTALAKVTLEDMEQQMKEYLAESECRLVC